MQLHPQRECAGGAALVVLCAEKGRSLSVACFERNDIGGFDHTIDGIPVPEARPMVTMLGSGVDRSTAKPFQQDGG